MLVRVHRTPNKSVRCSLIRTACTEKCEQRTVRTSQIVRTARTTNSANSSDCANSANIEHCERFILSEQCEQRTVRTVHTVRKVRTANSANSSFFRNRRTERTCANTVRWSLVGDGYWRQKASDANIQICGQHYRVHRTENIHHLNLDDISTLFGLGHIKYDMAQIGRCQSKRHYDRYNSINKVLRFANLPLTMKSYVLKLDICWNPANEWVSKYNIIFKI